MNTEDNEIGKSQHAEGTSEVEPILPPPGSRPLIVGSRDVALIISRAFAVAEELCS